MTNILIGELQRILEGLLQILSTLSLVPDRFRGKGCANRPSIKTRPTHHLRQSKVTVGGQETSSHIRSSLRPFRVKKWWHSTKTARNSPDETYRRLGQSPANPTEGLVPMTTDGEGTGTPRETTWMAIRNRANLMATDEEGIGTLKETTWTATRNRAKTLTVVEKEANQRRRPRTRDEGRIMTRVARTMTMKTQWLFERSVDGIKRQRGLLRRNRLPRRCCCLSTSLCTTLQRRCA